MSSSTTPWKQFLFYLFNWFQFLSFILHVFEVFFAYCKALKTCIALFRRSRQRRSVMGIANRTHPFHTTTPSPPMGTHIPDEEDEETFESIKTVVTVHAKESTVISNLHHFTSYQIEIHACNHPTDAARCSMAAYVSARTMPEGTDALVCATSFVLKILALICFCTQSYTFTQIS